MSEELTLFHGTPVKLRIGEYLDPSYCGMWENSKIYNPKNGKYDTKAIYFTPRFDIALSYARREIYCPIDATTDTKYFIFQRPGYAMYVYEVKIPKNLLYTAMGQPATTFIGEVCCTQKVRILKRHTYNIARILQHYSQQDEINTVARIIKKTPENCVKGKFYAPFSFGFQGCAGFVHFDNTELLKDLAENTVPVPRIPPCIYKQR